jgi:hypothetical protein
MSDIKTALVNALTEWDKQDAKAVAAVVPKPKVTASVAAFNIVRDNPGVLKKKAIAALELSGYKPSSTTSLLAAMVRQKQIRQTEDSKLYVIVQSYMPIKGSAYNKPGKKEKNVSPLAALIQAKEPSMPVPKPAPAPEPWCVHKLIDSLSIRQAIELSRELTSLFIGRTQ